MQHTADIQHIIDMHVTKHRSQHITDMHASHLSWNCECDHFTQAIVMKFIETANKQVLHSFY